RLGVRQHQAEAALPHRGHAGRVRLRARLRHLLRDPDRRRVLAMAARAAQSRPQAALAHLAADGAHLRQVRAQPQYGALRQHPGDHHRFRRAHPARARHQPRNPVQRGDARAGRAGRRAVGGRETRSPARAAGTRPGACRDAAQGGAGDLADGRCAQAPGEPGKQA
ncbi:hypothetical protein LTR94_032504, partial [Friedmanniomyces endolithicus]